MKIETIKQIVETSKYHSISSAAEATFVRQTSLSAMIQNAEAELGYQLFTRTKSGIQLTDNGENFVRIATELLEKYDELQLIGTRANKSTIFTLLMSSITTDRFGQEIVRQVNLRYPDVSVIARQEPRENIFPRVATGERLFAIDYVFTPEMERYKEKAERLGIQLEPLTKDYRFLYVGPHNKLYDKSTVRIADLDGVHLIGTPLGERERKLSAVYPHIHKMSILPSEHSIMSLLEASDMCAFIMSNKMPEDKFTTGTKIRKIKIEDEEISAWNILIYLRKMVPTSIELGILSDLKSIFSDLSSGG